jgi:hypothetical protein
VNMQVQQHIEGPIGIALYEWNNGQIGPPCLNEGVPVVTVEVQVLLG